VQRVCGYGGALLLSVCLSHSCCLWQEGRLVTPGKLSWKTKPEQNWVFLMNQSLSFYKSSA